jgi:hypothetical protein
MCEPHPGLNADRLQFLNSITEDICPALIEKVVF